MSIHQDESSMSPATYVAAPIAISATAQTESSITVTWGYMAGGGHTGTRLKWSTAGTPVGEFDVPIIGLRYVINGLSPDTRYQIQAFGLKGSEVSPASKDVDATTKPGSAVPAPPTSLAATPSKDSMALTWSGPAEASSYKLSYGVAPSGAVIGTATSATRAHTFSGLSAGTNYYFDIRSSNNVGDSSPARIVKQTLQVPATPTGLRATPAISAMDVEWTAVTGAVDYVIRHGIEPGGAVTTLTTGLPRQSLTNLMQNTLYFVEVSARNSNGESSPARITQKTLDGPALPPKPGSLHVITTHDAVTVTWGPPQSANYHVSMGIDTPQREVFVTEPTPYMNHRIQRLRPDTRYFIEVRAINASGESEPSVSSASTKVFQAPQELSLDELTDDTALLSWRAGADYTADTRYEVYLNNERLTTIAERSYRATGLNENTQYEFKVRAKGVGNYGLGDYFSAYSVKPFTTPAYGGERICSPGHLTGHRAATTAVLTWDEPYAMCNLCPNAVGYEISASGIPSINVTRPPCEIRGLDADREYRFSVRARGPANNISHPAEFVIGAHPGTPVSLQVTAVTGTSATLVWAAPGGTATVFDYSITCNGTLVGTSRGLDYALTPLQPESTYNVEVRTRSVNGGLSSPATATFTTGDASNVPRNLRVTANGNRRVSIAWEAPTGQAPIGYRVKVLTNSTDVSATVHTLYNLIPLLPLNIAVCCRFADGELSEWVYVPVIPKG
jgi:predicted phage tail protein